MTRRGDIRTSVADALECSAWGASFVRVKSVAQAIDSDTAPSFGVTVPLERTEKLDKEENRHETRLLVGFSRLGNDDLEDWLDEDAEAVELIVLEVLNDVVFEVTSYDIEFDIQAEEGGQRLGACIMSFECVTHSNII